MNKVLAFFVMLLPIFAQAQVRVAAEAPRQDKPTFKYDSTKNAMRFPDYYIGQDLFVIPADDEKIISTHYRFGKMVGESKRNTRLEGVPNTETVSGHTFHVICKQPYYLDNIEEPFCGVLLLEDKETGEMIYYKHDVFGPKLFPFIVLGYKEKFEQHNKDKKFVFKAYTLYNFDTGSPIEAHGTTWTFKEIIAIPNKMKPNFLLVDENGIQAAVEEMDGFIPKSDIDSYIRKYGKSMVETALDGSIKIGMPKELVVVAKGEPRNKNNGSHTDQWVYGKYGNDCVYFKNGKVTGWN